MRGVTTNYYYVVIALFGQRSSQFLLHLLVIGDRMRYALWAIFSNVFWLIEAV
jgi:hypothetical protein